MLLVQQETMFTTAGLIRVALIAALGFGLMAMLVDDRSRTLTIAVGMATVVAIVAILLYLSRQRRFGSATLTSAGAFEMSRTFAGTIVTEFRHAPRSPIRIRIAGWSTRNDVTLARIIVDGTSLQRAADGSIVIPFHIPPADDPMEWHPREVRLHARAADWPLGWGATFVIAKRD